MRKKLVPREHLVMIVSPAMIAIQIIPASYAPSKTPVILAVI